MGLKPSSQNCNNTVQKYIGTGYDTVKKVSESINVVNIVAENMEDINEIVDLDLPAIGSDVISAKDIAESAATTAVSAKDIAEDAAEAALTAKTQAQGYAGQASTSATAAVNAKSAAAGSASSALTAQSSAVSAKNSAVTAKDQAVSAKNVAVTAKTDAMNAANNASASSSEASESATSAAASAAQAVSDATSQVSLAAAEKVGAQTARDEAETHKNNAYTYSQSAASAVAYQDLTAIAQTKAETAVDVFVYDTSKDSDGGAWRHRTQGTSWYNETLNTATRGGRKEFPAVAVIVAESNKVTIYDGDDPSLPMWMVFNQDGSSGFLLGSIVVSSISVLNGQLAVGGADNYDGLYVLDFISEYGINYRASGISREFLGNVAGRSSAVYGANNSSLAQIVNHYVNDVAMTVLPNAPIDPATGLPIPTIAVATEGGVSVIKDDGTVVDITYTTVNSTVSNVIFNEFGGISYSNRDVSGGDAYWYTYKVIPESDTSAQPDSAYSVSQTGSGPIRQYLPQGSLTCAVNDNTDQVLGFTQGSYLGFSGGLFKLSQNPSLLSGSLPAPYSSVNSCHITSTYNTGWMNGDIKLATLSDTDDTDLVGSELVTNGTFDTDTSWTKGTGVTISGGVVTGTGSSGTLVEQSISLVDGQVYTVTFDIVSRTAGTIKPKWGSTTDLADINYSNVGSYSITAKWNTGDSESIRFYSNSFAGTIDNISVRLAEPDRSVNNNGLQVFGTVQKNPVATGADLVAYLPTGGGRLEQPYNPDLDFNTGDFCYMGWGKFNNTSSKNLVSRQVPDGSSLGVNRFLVGFHLSAGSIRVNVDSGNFISGYVPPRTATWLHVCATRKDGVLYIYVNGELQSSHSFTGNLDNLDAKVFTGSLYYNNVYTDTCQASLVRISATAPTAEQIKKIYEDEKVLFQENAKATLHGTSDAVTALAYDDTTELLHVGTSAGRSVFQGLRRVDNTTDAVGVAISASNNLVVEE